MTTRRDLLKLAGAKPDREAQVLAASKARKG